MDSNNQTVIKALKKISEDIDNVGLTDSGSWHKIRIEFENAMNSLEEKKEGLNTLIGLVFQGINHMGTQSADDPLSLVDAIWHGLNAVELCMTDQPDNDKAIEESRQNLAVILGSPSELNQDEKSTEHQELSPPFFETLNDAASFFIQLEPDNCSELTKLREFLLCLPEAKDGPENVRELILAVVQKMDPIIEGDTAATIDTLNEIGSILEMVIETIEASGGNSTPISNNTSCAEPIKAGLVNDSENNYMPADADAELIGEFIAEGSDLIENAEEALLTLETNPEDDESVGTVFRAFHTVKGTAAFLELTLISELGHHAESLLSRVRDGEIRYSGGYADLSLKALDMIKDLIARVQAALTGDRLIKPEGYDDLVNVLSNPEAAGISEENDNVDAPRIGDILVAQEKLKREQVENAIDAHPEEKLGVAVVKSQAASVKDVGQALRAQKRIKSTSQVVESSVRVSTQRMDRLIDMVGELVIAHSMIAQDDLISNSDNHELAKKVAHTSKIIRELQDVSMSMRMVPLKATFNKMARLVRDVSRKVGKNVNLVTEGEDTEIDRNLVNIINDPLVHMVRNAVDHGIETPEERKKKGKPECGDVQLLAYHSAGSVVVEIRDDGKGLDRDVILAKAREKGLIGASADNNDRSLSDREVFNMIFAPGFSTAQVVTDVSGRGVGMDVVKKNIESLRGQVEIKSEPNRGSIFRMSLPLTLAIIDGMVVRVGSETYVIPTISIVRSIKPASEDLSTVLQQGEMLALKDGLIPLYRMARLYQIEDAKDDPDDTIIVIVEDEDQRAGLVIDELIGRQQVVIKSLGETMKDIPGISGGAIMPDGRVGLIIDVGGLVKLANAGHKGNVREELESSTDQTLAA